MSRRTKVFLLSPLLGLAFSTAASGAVNVASRFPEQVLAAQNQVRAQAGLPPFAWDASLAQGAASYALQLAITNDFRHSDRRSRPGTGENLWMGTRGYYSYDAMVRGWASESRWFEPGVFPAVSRSGKWEDVAHYTQIIWPTTSRVGCALASNASADYLVCRYSPAGNVNGRVVANLAGGSISRAH